MNVVLPVILDTVDSLLAHNYRVDLFLIVGYTISESRQDVIRHELPEGVGLEVWNDATPFSYQPNQQHEDVVYEYGPSLARQHRLVVRDKLFHYDFFLAYEDDMYISGHHVDHYLNMTRKLQSMRQKAPQSLPPRMYGMPREKVFFGALTKKQLLHMKPGFLRVEIAMEETKPKLQQQVDNITVDLDFSNVGYPAGDQEVNASFCCDLKRIGLYDSASGVPRSDSLLVWETGIAGMGVRRLPDTDKWVGFLAGTNNRDYGNALGDYWAGIGGHTENRPHRLDPLYTAQMAGWMMSRQELLELLDECTLLPPFDPPQFKDDGKWRNTVEYWSGGNSLFCMNNGCNVQRVISLDPTEFSKHLMYHASNNKQTVVHAQRVVGVNELLGQLNTARKAAMATQDKILDG